VISKSPPIVVRRISDPPMHVVALSGDHDVSTLSDLELALTSVVASGKPVVVDLQRATFADSAILCAIINAQHQAGRRRFAIVMPPDGEVTRLFAMVGAAAVLATFSTLRGAIDWCSDRRRKAV
jgi:anti-anti-sigma factor